MSPARLCDIPPADPHVPPRVSASENLRLLERAPLHGGFFFMRTSGSASWGASDSITGVCCSGLFSAVPRCSRWPSRHPSTVTTSARPAGCWDCDAGKALSARRRRSSERVTGEVSDGANTPWIRTLLVRSVRAMTNSETQKRIRADTLASVVTMYPMAFTMVVASNSRAGLALRREVAELRDCRGDVGPVFAAGRFAPGRVTPHGPAPACGLAWHL